MCTLPMRNTAEEPVLGQARAHPSHDLPDKVQRSGGCSHCAAKAAHIGGSGRTGSESAAGRNPSESHGPGLRRTWVSGG